MPAWFAPLIGAVGRGVASGVVKGAVVGSIKASGAMIGGVISAIGGIMGGVLSALAPSDKDENGNTVVVVNSEDGKKGFASKNIQRPKIKHATKVNVNANMTSNQLLEVALNYLTAIDENMKASLLFDEQSAKLDMAAAREVAIESDKSGGGFFNLFGKKSKIEKVDAEEEKQKSSLISSIAKFGAIAGALALIVKALDKINLDSIFEVENPTTQGGTFIDEKIADAVDGAPVVVREAVNNALPSTRRIQNTEKANKARSYFEQQGWTTEQSSAIVGNLIAESQLDPSAVGDGGKAYGIAQWHPPRQKSFEREFGIPIRESTFEQQLQFVNWELNNTEKSAGNRLRETSDVMTGASVVDEYYERSSGEHRSKRIQYSIDVLANSGADADAIQEEFDSGTSISESTDSQSTPETNNSSSNILNSLMNVLKATNPDPSATYRPDITSEEPDYSRYTDLYYKNLEMENNTIAGMKAERKSERESGAAQITATQSAFAEANDGSLDVINPNYGLKDNEIISDYLGSFGYR